jgi:hypothetical protein
MDWLSRGQSVHAFGALEHHGKTADDYNEENC